MNRRTALALVATLAGCAQPAPRPDDMSAAAHREEAAHEREAAQQSLAEHGAHKRLIDSRLPGDHAGLITREEYGPAGPTIGPRGATPDLYAAEARVLHAREHEAAASELERFEDAECAGIPPAERSACPLLRGAGAVVDVADGLEVRFRPGAPVDDVQRRMRCHLAYARTRGYLEDAACALYFKGVRIERPDPWIIRITAQDPRTVARLHAADR